MRSNITNASSPSSIPLHPPTTHTQGSAAATWFTCARISAPTCRAYRSSYGSCSCCRLCTSSPCCATSTSWPYSGRLAPLFITCRTLALSVFCFLFVSSINCMFSVCEICPLFFAYLPLTLNTFLQILSVCLSCFYLYYKLSIVSFLVIISILYPCNILSVSHYSISVFLKILSNCLSWTFCIVINIMFPVYEIYLLSSLQHSI